MKSSLLVLFALVGISSSFNIFFWRDTTHVHGSGTVHCDLPGRWWCFQVNLYEQDGPLMDDRVDFFGTRCSRNPSYNYYLNGTQVGDGMLFWNTFYEFKFEIIHNCTSEGWKMRKIERLHTQYAPTSALDVEIMPWNTSILNLGERGYEFV